ncbi:TIGR03013 family XrtA/PEP-CTERM system glycosyltransferase [Oleiagrimonas sp. C23AA]|uniref:TIGR03013 family XrtA/PEP-CTERM system glycosyltransferase n=1 Tax=Oleiagrimonas sp. C23AA TaxID=2719047 RepID=UPI00141FBCE4|nr:TIGR03013 family XrtA/PEP-CTERM system glycosyltransferase [Oleiagrimonas sp. C23AA]NII11177.1 TIGR03013 family PEP-CTERM/XrtA system glycosyltransferase [Oleiagrimonas sp. C23AA]
MYRVFRLRAVRWQLFLVLVDVALLVASIHIALWLRFWGDPASRAVSGDGLLWRACLAACIMSLGMAALGLYQMHLRASWLGQFSRLIVGFMLGSAALAVLYYAIPAAYIGRGILGISLLLGAFLIALWRIIFLGFLDTDALKRRVIIFGAGERAAQIARKMRRKTDQRGFKVLGYVPVGQDPVNVPESLLIHPDQPICDWIAELDVDEIVVGPDERRDTLPVDALMQCKVRGVEVTEISEFFEREAGSIKLELNNLSWLVFSGGFNISPLRNVIKRAFDIVVASLVLLVAWPFMLVTALAIRLESGRGAPILYRQERVGANGKPFMLIKFRSMRTDAEINGVAQWATTNDSRVTRTGQLIRKTRLDELPQLWNVLRGNMSIIGPRPERPQFVKDFNISIPYYPLRHSVKPGLTGWAQLRYPYGASMEDAQEKLKFDLFYVKNHSLIFDIAILIQTVEVVLFGRGAR